MKYIASGLTTNRWWGRDLNPFYLTSKAVRLYHSTMLSPPILGLLEFIAKFKNLQASFW